MEGVVAKRCLRESSINRDERINFQNNKINSVYRKHNLAGKVINKENTYAQSFLDKFKFKLKMKLWLQAITAMTLVIFIIILSMLDINVINENKYVRMLKQEYKKSYSLSDIKENSKVALGYCRKGIKYVMPEKVQNRFKEIYKDFKSIFQNENNGAVVIYEENALVEVNDNVENTGIGVSIDENEPSEDIASQTEESSAISVEDECVQCIKESNIVFVMPTKGTVSSEFGAREVIFSDIDSYHTGIDIANVKGTDIMAATDGIVTKVANNKYNGNFVEITNGKVVTKYAHMDSVSVKVDKEVKKGEVIGKMGETGYATGPHLHFEVVVNGTKINPAKVLNI